MLSIKVLVVLVTIIVSTNCAPSMPSDCPNRLKEMDKSMKFAIMITNPNQVLYTNESHVNEDYCIPVTRYHQKVISDYRPCLRAFPKQLFSIVLANSKKNTKATCTTANQRKQLVENLKCFTKDTYQELVQLGHHVTSLVEHLANMSNIDNIIPGMCCGYYMSLTESKTEIDRLCERQGVGSSGTEYFLGMIKSAVADAVDMMCGSYPTIKVCEEKSPNLVAELTNVMNETRNTKYNYTMVIPFLKVIDRIDTETNINN